MSKQQLISFLCVFHNGGISLHSHQQCIKVLFPFRYILTNICYLCFFLVIATLISVRWYLTVVLICVSLMISDAEHLFISLLAICVSSLKKHLFRSSAHFLVSLFVLFFILSLWAICILDINPLSDIPFANSFSHSIDCPHDPSIPLLVICLKEKENTNSKKYICTPMFIAALFAIIKVTGQMTG